MILDAAHCQLILIDFQPKLMAAIEHGDRVTQRAALLAEAARLLHVPCIGTEQNPASLGPLHPQLRQRCKQVMPKMHFSACRDGLVDFVDAAATPPQGGNARSVPKHLQKPREKQRTHLVIAGCEAHVCLLQTALDLIDSDEYDLSVVTDASGSRHTVDRDAAFDRLAGAGAQLVTAEMVLFEWLGSADHACFKELQSLVKLSPDAGMAALNWS